MKGKLRSPMANVDSRIVTIRARLREIEDRVRSESIGTSDIDTAVVLDLLDAAQECAAAATFALHPEFDDLDDDDLAEAFLVLDVEHSTEPSCPRENPRDDLEFVSVLVSLYACGVLQIVDGRADVASEVLDQMANVIDLMSFIAYVLDPDAEDDTELDAAERVVRASRLEQYELLLEEARARCSVN